MGGSNCWVPECGLSRDTRGVYFWKLPCTRHPEDVKWRKDVEDMIKRYRVVDKSLSDRLASGKIFTCEHHYKDDDFEYTASGRKKLKLYRMPSLNLPKKSHEIPPKSRPVVPRLAPQPVPKPPGKCYANLPAFNRSIELLKKLDPWTFTISADNTTLLLSEHPSLIPKLSIKMEVSLKFSVLVYNWPLPDNHLLHEIRSLCLQYTYLPIPRRSEEFVNMFRIIRRCGWRKITFRSYRSQPERIQSCNCIDVAQIKWMWSYQQKVVLYKLRQLFL